MSRRGVVWLAWSLCGLSQALTVFGLIFLFLDPSYPVEPIFNYWGDVAVMAVAFSTVGAIVASRRPENPIGWIFCAIGVLTGLRSLRIQYAIYAFVTAPGDLRGAETLVLVTAWDWIPYVALLVLLGLLFPNGRLPSKRWRPLAWLTVVVASASVVALVILPEPLYALGSGRRNPLGIEGLNSAALDNAVQISMYSLALLSAASLFVRLGRAKGVERQQLKWITLAGALAAAGAMSNRGLYPLLEIGWLWPVSYVLMMAGLICIPISMGIAMLRHHLYDIDLLINRALVYTVLTAVLALVYFGSIVLLQHIIVVLHGEKSQLTIVASTLAIAALFNPLRTYIQSFIDRRFYRGKYDAARTVENFSVRLRSQPDLDGLSGDLASVVRETVRPEHVSIWLREPGSGAGDSESAS